MSGTTTNVERRFTSFANNVGRNAAFWTSWTTFLHKVTYLRNASYRFCSGFNQWFQSFHFCNGSNLTSFLCPYAKLRISRTRPLIELCSIYGCCSECGCWQASVCIPKNRTNVWNIGLCTPKRSPLQPNKQFTKGTIFWNTEKNMKWVEFTGVETNKIFSRKSFWSISTLPNI